MTKQYFKTFCLLFLAMLGMAQTAAADTAFRNFAVNLTDGTFATDVTNFGVKVEENGTYAATTADDATANFTVNAARWNDLQHGWVNCVFTIPVEGPVLIKLGDCQFGAQTGTIVDSEENTTELTKPAKKCWASSKPDENVVATYYRGLSPTTLTVTYTGYCPFISVTAVDPADLPAETPKATVSFAAGEATGAIVPASIEDEVGKEITLPVNYTMYVEGKTLTGWSDGNDTYAPGAAYTVPAADITLQPVFTANEVALGDRTEPVTVKWNFRRDQGAPVIAWQGTNGNILVAQATIGGKTIDVPMTVNTNPGKFNNQNNTDWIQTNIGTKFTIPACKGAVVSMEGYAEFSTTTIDGQNDYTSGRTISYTLAGNAETVDIVIGVKPTNETKSDCEYTRYIQVVLPVVQSGAKTYTDADANVRWPFASHATINDTEKTADVFSTTSFEILGDLTTSTKAGVTQLGTGTRSQDPDNGLAFLTFTGESNMQLHWNIKPVSGLTFTPTQIKMYVQRFGTNKENGVVITAKKEDGTIQTLGTYTARRANWTTDQEKGQFNWTEVPATLVNEVVIDLTAEQQTALTSADGFHLYAVTGLGNDKAGGFSDIRVYGKVNGTAADVAKYTLDIAASPAEGGSVTKYPNTDEYEEGTTVKVTATKNFGYDFVNWTNEAGAEVSTEPVYQFDITQNEKLTANFQAVNTYELKLNVDGTNDYMVKVSPAPTIVGEKWMYEAGTAVELTADQYEGLVTFTNWSDGTTGANKVFTMDDNVTLTANYSETDIVAGWDFYTAGNNGRKADFHSADNEAAALSLVNNDDGSTSSWLDKSTLGGGGYESFKGAATNWRTGSSNGDVGHYHWQTKVNAEAFTDIKVQFQMLYNYNAYQTYKAEYSLDGEEWTSFGSITMSGAKAPASFSETLPAACNNQASLYIRMIADKESDVAGTASANDGNTLAMFFITGTPKLVDDPVPPTLQSSVPEDGATGASATGKIVLNFDKKVQIVEGTKATLGSMELTPAVSGKVITFSYKGLEYATEYTFTLPASTVKNLTGATLTDAITLTFTTMVRPSVTKALYDKVVSNSEELVAALNAAQSRTDKNVRYRIFLKKGTYTLPQGTADKTYEVELQNGTTSFTKKDPITYFNAQNVSVIGEDRDATIITNTIPAEDTFEGKYGTASIYEGIGKSDVFQLSGSNSYWQDLTVSTGMDDARGRDIAVEDKGTRTIWKNTKLHGYQDTWVGQSDNGLFYFEDGIIRGRTDYICGKGDAYYNRVEFQQIAGGYCAVPSKPANIGWVMKDCVINGDGSGVDGNYTLGRPWGSGTPVALWIDTKMNVVPSAIGWNEMSGGWPARFAEYNSTTKTGTVIDLSGRKTIFADTHENNPVLTAAEALEYSDMSKMFGDWDPTLLTEQAPIPANVKQNGNSLEWDDSNYALLYAVVKDGEIIDFTTENSFEMTEDGTYSVRAANEMGGLSEASEAVTATGVVTGIQTLKNDNEAPVVTGDIYTLQGIRVDKARKGLYIIGGRKVVIK